MKKPFQPVSSQDERRVESFTSGVPDEAVMDRARETFRPAIQATVASR